MSQLPDIVELVPHRGPMLLLNRVIWAQEKSICCEVDISPQSTFFLPDLAAVPCHIGIEYMAQCIAALAGVEYWRAKKPIPIGLLLGGRRYQSNGQSFSAGTKLNIFAEELIRDGAMGVYQCRIELNGQQLASCQINTYVPTNEQLLELTTKK
ncbi:hotdog family protein [Paraferrimonas sedimenticola]|uniref:Thioester dehydrase n=1 Tax=Paraferrimonas sedimenticola TaxID=375674 RepID=A0AA37RX48_9GAMM|nr:hotdog family protein [Paraferrimonas sedimenticola]GLP97041.1 thioester dehydrase [Paraferrimonas sedimenticola]